MLIGDVLESIISCDHNSYITIEKSKKKANQRYFYTFTILNQSLKENKVSSKNIYSKNKLIKTLQKYLSQREIITIFEEMLI